MVQAFRYGAGNAAVNGVGSEKLTLVIADDSCALAHIAGNKAIAAEIGQLGLTIMYFGLQERQAVLAE